MKHARSDYDPIQDPRGIIPVDEPVFLLRGQDMHAAATLRLYARFVTGHMREVVLAHAKLMDAWQKKKEPDL